MQDAFTFLKVVVVFILVVWAIRRRFPIGLALSGGGIAVALLMGRPLGWIGRELAGGLDSVLFEAETRRFVTAMGLIVALTTVLQASGEMNRITASFGAWLRRPRVTLATLPAIIGLLPMPGGALFSAPMVEASAAGTPLSAEDKALVNYWYRHVWECVCPIYGSVILCAHLIHREVKVVSLALLPIAVAAIVAGLGFLGERSPRMMDNGSRRRAALGAITGLLPLIILFAIYGATPASLPLAAAAGLLFAAAWHLLSGHVGAGELVKVIFTRPAVLEMTVMGFGALIFAAMMARSGAIDGISSLFVSMGLPLMVLAIAMPFAVAFFSGMTIVYVSTTFPLLLGFPGVRECPLPVIALAFAAGFCGMLVSPLHSCLVVSTRYFRADLMGPIRRMIVPCFVILATGAALWGLLRSFKL
jgi:integral membrane protein (TIGR00529 family)